MSSLIEFKCNDCGNKFKRGFDWTGLPGESVCPECGSSDIETDK